jgi:hypothetical protein
MSHVWKQGATCEWKPINISWLLCDHVSNESQLVLSQMAFFTSQDPAKMAGPHLQCNNIFLRMQIMMINFMQFSHVISALLCQSILSALLSNTLDLCSFANARGRVLQPYKTTWRKILNILIFTFWTENIFNLPLTCSWIQFWLVCYLSDRFTGVVTLLDIY